MPTGRQTQQTGRAGEYYVAAELNRRGFDAVTFTGNMPEFDAIAVTARRKTLYIQVKAQTGRGWALNINESPEAYPQYVLGAGFAPQGGRAPVLGHTRRGDAGHYPGPIRGSTGPIRRKEDYAVPAKGRGRRRMARRMVPPALSRRLPCPGRPPRATMNTRKGRHFALPTLELPGLAPMMSGEG